MSSRLRIILSVVLAVYWCLMFWGTHKPADNTPAVSNDKLLHFLAYAGLAFLISLSLFWWRNPRKWVWIALVVVTYGAIDELTQPSFGRSAEFADWVADAFGCAAGLIVYHVAQKTVRRRDPIDQASPGNQSESTERKAD